MDDEFGSFVKTHVVSVLLSVGIGIFILFMLAGVAFTVDKLWFAQQVVKVLGKAVVYSEKQEDYPISTKYLKPFEVTYWNGNQVTFFLDDEVHEASVLAGNELSCDPLYLEIVAFSESPTYQNTQCSSVGACGTWQFMLGTFRYVLSKVLGLDPNAFSRFDRKIAAKAACAYLKMTGAADAVNKSKVAHRLTFAVIAPVWNMHAGQADFVWETYHTAKLMASGGEETPTEQVNFSFKSNWAEYGAKFLKFVGLWPAELISSEPWGDFDGGEGSPFPGVAGVCRPVPEEAFIKFGFGVEYRWGIHYGTDFDMPGLKDVPAFALLPGTVTTGWHYSVDGIVNLYPDGYDNVVIKYFHMNEGSINGLSGHVECGQSLGFADGGGKVSDGKHLHLQIEVDGVRVDPMKWIEGQR